MKRVVLGTAGHIDHGKTTLIKALTGVDCDRLKEEKERGITIELGFTSLSLPGGQEISIVDVPGHEKFVRHMVAGATGIDLVALVIAADEGVMPQTREHLDICRLLRVKKGLVALTKIDLVEKDWLDLVKEEIREFVKGTFLEGAAILPLSSLTGEGLPALLAEIERLAEEVEERSPEGLFRLPIDRVFTMKGFGTVVTGTIVSGKVSVGDTLEVLPKGLEAKVRGIQAHGKPVESATAGLRTGINLQGLEKAVIDRGNVLVQAQTLKSTLLVDGVFQLLPGAPKAPEKPHPGPSSRRHGGSPGTGRSSGSGRDPGRRGSLPADPRRGTHRRPSRGPVCPPQLFSHLHHRGRRNFGRLSRRAASV